MSREDGPELYAAWIVIVQVAAKCSPRGTLADEHGPLTAEDVALKTKFPTAIISEALNFFSSRQIGWLLVAEWEPSGSTLPLQDSTEQDTTGQNKTPGAANAAGSDNEPPKDSSPVDQLPPELDQPAFHAAWSEWIAYRKERRLTTRERTMSAQLHSLAPLGPSAAVECVRASIRNGWQGLFPEKCKAKNHGPTIGPGQRHDPNARGGNIGTF